MIVKLSPYMSPFSPPSEPGVYWLGLEYQGECLHDAHVLTRRQFMRERALSWLSGRPYTATVTESIESAESVLASCGLGHMAVPARLARAESSSDHLEALAAEGVRAARRRLKSVQGKNS